MTASRVARLRERQRLADCTHSPKSPEATVDDFNGSSGALGHNLPFSERGNLPLERLHYFGKLTDAAVVGDGEKGNDPAVTGRKTACERTDCVGGGRGDRQSDMAARVVESLQH